MQDNLKNTYVLLFRGINVGGKNKIPMQELKNLLTAEGFSDVRSYISSGNIIFVSESPENLIRQKIRSLIDRSYPGDISFILMDGNEYLEETSLCPDWWSVPMARKDVLFLMDEADPESVRERIMQMPLRNESVSFGKRTVFWGKHTEKEYSKTAYHRLLLKESFYSLITIRNARTFEKIAEMLHAE